MNPENTSLLEARQAALRRLDRRECSTGDLSQNLRRKGFAPDIIAQVIEELVEKKYIDNDKYARILVREQTLRGKGPHWIRMKLLEKGISMDRSVIDNWIREANPTSELDVVKGILTRRYAKAKTDPATAKKAIQALLRRGFSYETARNALAVFKYDDVDKNET